MIHEEETANSSDDPGDPRNHYCPLCFCSWYYCDDECDCTCHDDDGATDCGDGEDED